MYAIYNYIHMHNTYIYINLRRNYATFMLLGLTMHLPETYIF